MTNEKPNAEACGECKYYTAWNLEAPRRTEGVCRRYPSPRTKDENDWCGEFRDAKREAAK